MDIVCKLESQQKTNNEFFNENWEDVLVIRSLPANSTMANSVPATRMDETVQKWDFPEVDKIGKV